MTEQIGNAIKQEELDAKAIVALVKKNGLFDELRRTLFKELRENVGTYIYIYACTLLLISTNILTS